MSPLSKGDPTSGESWGKDFSHTAFPRLLDDRSRPDFRETFGVLARRARGLDVALTHMRLATLDLSEAELGRMHRVRLLLAEVSDAALDAEAHAVLNRPNVAKTCVAWQPFLPSGALRCARRRSADGLPTFPCSVTTRDTLPYSWAHIVSTDAPSTGGQSWPLSMERQQRREWRIVSVRSGNKATTSAPR